MRWIIPLLLSATHVMANPMLIEDFSDGEAPGWQYVSDRVMGGVSDGGAQLLSEEGRVFARLAGEVSTANNGGFIQMRRAVDALPEGAAGLKLRLRGNGADYYVHLRPKAAQRPWQYFGARFSTTGDWEEITLIWSDFKAQGGLGVGLDPAEILSLGIVAYGADYTARLDVSQVEAIAAP